MSNLRVLTTSNQNNNESCIEILKEILEEAEQGQVTAIAVVYTRLDRSVVTQSSDTENFPGLIGALEILKHRMLTEET